MSNLAVIGMIGALLVAHFAVIGYTSHRIQEMTHLIVAGVWSGVRLPIQYRKLMVYHYMVLWLAGTFVYLFLLTIVFIEIGRNVDDQRIRLVAYLAAVPIGATSVWTLVLGPARLWQLFRYLRQEGEATTPGSQ